MSATAGRKAQIKVSGTAIAFTDEACTTIAANTVYQITNTVKQVVDRTVTVVVKKDTVSQASTLWTFNRLTGTVTFLADIGGGHTITISGSYLPMSIAAEAKSMDYSLVGTMLEDNVFGDLDVTRLLGLQDFSGTLSQWQRFNDTYFYDTLFAGTPVVLEFSADSSAAFNRRAWVVLSNNKVNAPVGGIVDESVSFAGTPDSDGRILSR